MSKLSKINSKILVGISCHLGVGKAIEFAAYARSLEDLTEPQKKLLLRGWLAIQHLPGDASLEAADLHECLRALSVAWRFLEQET